MFQGTESMLFDWEGLRIIDAGPGAGGALEVRVIIGYPGRGRVPGLRNGLGSGIRDSAGPVAGCPPARAPGASVVGQAKPRY